MTHLSFLRGRCEYPRLTNDCQISALLVASPTKSEMASMPTMWPRASHDEVCTQRGAGKRKQRQAQGLRRLGTRHATRKLPSVGLSEATLLHPNARKSKSC